MSRSSESRRFIQLLAGQLSEAGVDVETLDHEELKERFVDAVSELPDGHVKDCLSKNTTRYFGQLKTLLKKSRVPGRSLAKKAKLNACGINEEDILFNLTFKEGFGRALEKISKMERDSQLKLGFSVFQCCLESDDAKHVLSRLFVEMKSCEEVAVALKWLTRALIGRRNISVIEAVMEKVLELVSSVGNLEADHGNALYESTWKITHQCQFTVSTLVGWTRDRQELAERLTHLVSLSLAKSHQHIADVALQVTSSLESTVFLFKLFKPLFFLTPTPLSLSCFAKYLAFARLLLRWCCKSGVDVHFQDQQRIRNTVYELNVPRGLREILKRNEALEGLKDKKGRALLTHILDGLEDEKIDKFIELTGDDSPMKNDGDVRIEGNQRAELYVEDGEEGAAAELSFFVDVKGDSDALADMESSDEEIKDVEKAKAETLQSPLGVQTRSKTNPKRKCKQSD
eukprot:m.130376 g.130376  ORF g.130376 m.130376 type:complete len:457 (+) comp38023_c0_seq5:241-1611(+)